MPESELRKLVVRYYHELWNAWNLAVADEILAPEFRFRGSFGTELIGIAPFKQYVQTVRKACSDFTNIIEQTIEAAPHVVAKLRYEGTHSGNLLGVPATGKRIVYPGIAIFEAQKGRLLNGTVVGDRCSLLECVLGRQFWLTNRFVGGGKGQ